MDPQPLELPDGGLSDGVVAVRPYRVEDASLLAEGAQDDDVVRFAFVRWGDDTPEQLERRIAEEWPERAREGRILNVSIRDATTDGLLGHFVVFGVDRLSARCEVGFWLRPEARGRGAVRRAVDLVCRWAFRELGLARVQASTDVENVASQRTLEKAGFRREGIMRSFSPTPDGGRADFYLYARLATD